MRQIFTVRKNINIHALALRLDTSTTDSFLCVSCILTLCMYIDIFTDSENLTHVPIRHNYKRMIVKL